MDYPKRKHVRLKEYDYRSQGYYFITICTYEKRQILSHISNGKTNVSITLTEYGKAVEEELLALQKRYSYIRVDKYTIMPNHIHVIFAVNEGAEATINTVVGVFKSLATRNCKRIRPIEKVFQTSFYEHVIRNQRDYEEIWNYIDGNPMKWKADCFYSESDTIQPPHREK